MKSALFTGVCTALVTPFLGKNVNYPMMDLLLRRQVEAAGGGMRIESAPRFSLILELVEEA